MELAWSEVGGGRRSVLGGPSRSAYTLWVCNEAIQSLHRYFIWANQMRAHYYDLVPKIANDPSPDRFSAEVIKADLYMSLWYGELYVVIEGWKELGLSDRAVDALLASPNVDLLKRYRNGAFHFQKNYFDERFLEFIRDGKDAAAWVDDLNRAFGDYFIRRFSQQQTASSSATV